MGFYNLQQFHEWKFCHTQVYPQNFHSIARIGMELIKPSRIILKVTSGNIIMQTRVDETRGTVAVALLIIVQITVGVSTVSSRNAEARQLCVETAAHHPVYCARNLGGTSASRSVIRGLWFYRPLKY